MTVMRSVRVKKSNSGVPWTFVATGKDKAPRRVLLSRVDATPLGRTATRSPRKVNPVQVARRLEKAFIKTVKAIKRNAAKTAKTA